MDIWLTVALMCLSALAGWAFAQPDIAHHRTAARYWRGITADHRHQLDIHAEALRRAYPHTDTRRIVMRRAADHLKDKP